MLLTNFTSIKNNKKESSYILLKRFVYKIMPPFLLNFVLENSYFSLNALIMLMCIEFIIGYV